MEYKRSIFEIKYINIDHFLISWWREKKEMSLSRVAIEWIWKEINKNRITKANQPKHAKV